MATQMQKVLGACKPMRPFLALVGAILLGYAGQRQFANKGLTQDALILYGAGIVLFLLAARRREDILPEPAPERRTRLWHWALALAGAGLSAAAALIFYQRTTSNTALWLWLAGMALFVAAFLLTVPLKWPRLEHREGLILAGILLTALFMRAWQIGSIPGGLYLDEADNGLWGLRFVSEPYSPFTEHRDSNAAMFYQITGLLLKAFGINGLVMRWQDIIVGMLTVLVFYLLARAMFGVRPAQVATALLAVSHWHVNFSRLAFVEIVPVPLIQGLVILFLWRGYQHRRKADFALAGLFLGLGLHTYIGYRIFPVTIALFLLYFAFKQPGWLRRNLTQVALLGAGILVAAAPLGVFVIQRPQIFLRRAQAASVQNDIERENSYRPLRDNIEKTLLMFNRAGDPRPRHNLPNEPMLDFFTAIAFGLGWGYALWNWRRSRYFIPLLWMLLGFLPGVLSLNDSNPHASRTLGNVMPAFLLVAVFWDGAIRVAEGVALGRLRRYFNVALATLLAVSAVLNYQVYFIKQPANQSVYYDFDPAQNLAGQYIKANADSGYLLVSFALTNHSAVKFIPYGKTYQVLDPNRHIPLRDVPDRDVTYVLEMPHAYLLPTLRQLYPAGALEEHRDRYGMVAFYTFRLSREQISATQGLTGQFFAGDKAEGAPAAERHVATLDLTFAGGDPIAAPFTARWDGALFVPSYGEYALTLDAGGPAELKLDEETLIKTEGGPAQTRRLLPGGFHALQVTYYQAGAEGRLTLRWTPPGGGESVIPQNAFYAPDMARFGLLGRYFRGAENWSGQPALMQIDPFVAANDPLPAPFSIEWQGSIYAPQDGRYRFATVSDDGSFVYIDTKLVVDNGGHHGDRLAEGFIDLSKGLHQLVIRYFQVDGGRKMELYWTPPNGAQQLVPTQYLLPPGSTQVVTPPLPAPAQPAATPAAPAQPGQAAPAPKLPPLANIRFVAAFGREGAGQGQMRQPRGVAIGPNGLIYVADAGNKRVQVFKADGSFVRAWNKGADLFGEPFDIAIDKSGRVYVLDVSRQTISRFSPDGEFQAEFGADMGMYGPRGLGIGPDGALYVADTGSSRILKLSPDGAQLGVPVQGGKGKGQVQQPTDVAVDAEGRLYIVDLLNGRLQVLDAAGRFVTEWRINGANTTDSPHVDITPGGRLLLTDPEAHKVLVYDGQGNPLGEWGGEGSDQGQFRKTLGIGAGPGGLVAVSDVYNSRVQLFNIGEGN